MRTPRHGAAAGTIGDEIYVVGGGPAGGTSFSSANEAFSFANSTEPAAPSITDTDPDSPANDNSPEVKGTVGAGSPTQVKIYVNASCSGAPDATGTVAQFTGAGITVNVPGDPVTALSARASDAASNDSACSNTINYVEDSTGGSAGGIPRGNGRKATLVGTPGADDCRHQAR